MPTEFELLMSLDDEPRGPSRVDIQRAIADGRRRRIHRGIGYTGAAAVTALAVAGASMAAGSLRQSPTQAAATGTGRTAASTPAKAKAKYTIPGTPGWRAPAATAPTSCTLDRLPVPDNAPQALVSGADPAGRYIVGRSYPKAGGYQAVIWHDGKVDKVMLPGDLEESLQDVNSAGTAVGWSYAGRGEDTGPVPYVYHDGKVSKLPGVKRGSAYAINDAGAIAGDDSGDAALVWPSATAQPIRLPLPAGASEATARDIDEDGTVVGTVSMGKGKGTAPSPTDVPYVWFADGTHRPLPMPTIDDKQATTGRVFSVRNGWATGAAVGHAGAAGLPDTGNPFAKATPKPGSRSAQTRAVRWNIRTGEVRVFDQLRFGADATNAQGWQLGTDREGRAVLLAAVAPVVLPGLADHQPGGLSTIPSTVSDDGRVIAGQSDDSNGKIQAIVWRCR